MIRFRWITAGAQGLAILLLTLVLTEGAFRAFHHFRPSFIFSSDSYQQFRPPPYSKDYGFRLNSLGFKDLEPDPNHDGPRIVAIGDSFAYGVVPYEHNYLTLLDDLLDDSIDDSISRGSSSVEVINMGIPRLDVKDYRQLLVDEALEFEPDLVMVGFFIGNDFHIRPREASARRFLVHDFFRYLFLIWPKQTVGFHLTDYHDNQPTFLEEVFLELRTGAAWRFLPGSVMLDTNLGEVVSTLSDMQRTAERQGSRFLVTLLPDELQVDRNLQEIVIKRMGVDGEIPWEKPNTEMVRALEGAGIPVFDLLPAFLEAGRHQRLYKPRDTHWNVAGNRLAAEEIARFLAESELLARADEADPARPVH